MLRPLLAPAVSMRWYFIAVVVLSVIIALAIRSGSVKLQILLGLLVCPVAIYLLCSSACFLVAYLVGSLNQILFYQAPRARIPFCQRDFCLLRSFLHKQGISVMKNFLLRVVLGCCLLATWLLNSVERRFVHYQEVRTDGCVADYLHADPDCTLSCTEVLITVATVAGQPTGGSRA